MDLGALPIKRIAIVSSLILLVGGVLFALWAVQWKPVTPGGTIDTTQSPYHPSTQPVGGLGGESATPVIVDTTPSAGTTNGPSPAQGPEQVVFSTLAISLAPDPAGGVVAFNPATSTFVHIDANGTTVNKSEERFVDVRGVTWSHDRSVAVIEDASGKSIYNFNTKERIAVPSNWQEFSFSPDNHSIAFKNIGEDTESQWLATTNLVSGKVTLVTALGDNANRVHVDWAPGNTALGFTTIPVDGNTQELSFIDPDGSLTSSTSIKGAFFQSQWADSGKLFVFSTADVNNRLKPRLWVALGDGEHRGAYQELPISTTANQCAFGGANDRILVCAVPETSTDSYGILGDIPPVPHHLVAIDLATGVPKTLYEPSTPTTLKNPVIDNTGKKIYITNATTGQLETVPFGN